MALIFLMKSRLRGAGYDDPNNSNTYEYRDLYRGVGGAGDLVEPKHGGFGCTLLSSVVERGCKCKMGMELNVFMEVLGGRGLGSFCIVAAFARSCPVLGISSTPATCCCWLGAALVPFRTATAPCAGAQRRLARARRTTRRYRGADRRRGHRHAPPRLGHASLWSQDAECRSGATSWFVCTIPPKPISTAGEDHFGKPRNRNVGSPA